MRWKSKNIFSNYHIFHLIFALLRSRSISNGLGRPLNVSRRECSRLEYRFSGRLNHGQDGCPFNVPANFFTRKLTTARKKDMSPPWIKLLPAVSNQINQWIRSLSSSWRGHEHPWNDPKDDRDREKASAAVKFFKRGDISFSGGKYERTPILSMA